MRRGEGEKGGGGLRMGRVRRGGEKWKMRG